MSFKSFVKGNIFREYIGAKSIPKLNEFPVKIINHGISEFHFILAFATEDYYPDTKKGKGNFSPSWDVSDFGPAAISNLKKDYKNVKVVISIGGRGTEYPFNPQNKIEWINNAKKSLKEIIENDYKYKDDCGCGDKTVIDGIDINYQYVESDDFVECIGEIIDYVKSIGLKVSISPTDSKDAVLSKYKDLYKDNNDNIDWVNYQFYDQKISKPNDFVNLYKSLRDFFSSEKLLAGVSTDPTDSSNIPQEVFLQGCKALLKSDSLPGIFVWNANDSKVLEDPYYVEIKAQSLLINPNS